MGIPGGTQRQSELSPQKIGQIFILFAFCFSTVAKATDIVVDISIGNLSSDGGSGPILPPIEKSTLFEAVTNRQNTLVYGAALKLEAASWLYPTFGLRFARQEAWIRGGHERGSVGNSYRTESRSSLNASSTTDIVWMNFGLEVNFPARKNGRRSWRSLVFGIGGSLIYAKDRTRGGSKYVTHFERWENIDEFNPERQLVEQMHEEQDLGGFSSSGFGAGWYFLFGVAFHFSETVSLMPKIQFDFTSVNMQSKRNQIRDRLKFGSGTIGLSSSIRF